MSPNHTEAPSFEIVILSLDLAENCIGNLACYSAGWKVENSQRQLINNNDFWKRANGNFLDMATIEWCKLFLDKNKNKSDFAECNWKNIFKNHDEWRSDLLTNMSISLGDFEKAGKSILDYRNKYLAHRERSSKDLFYPRTDFMLQSTLHLHKMLQTCCEVTIHSGQITIEKHYDYWLNEARNEILRSVIGK